MEECWLQHMPVTNINIAVLPPTASHAAADASTVAGTSAAAARETTRRMHRMHDPPTTTPSAASDAASAFAARLLTNASAFAEIESATAADATNVGVFCSVRVLA